MCFGVGVFRVFYVNSVFNPDPNRLKSDKTAKTGKTVKTVIFVILQHRTDRRFQFDNFAASHGPKWKRMEMF